MNSKLKWGIVLLISAVVLGGGSWIIGMIIPFGGCLSCFSLPIFIVSIILIILGLVQSSEKEETTEAEIVKMEDVPSEEEAKASDESKADAAAEEKTIEMDQTASQEESGDDEELSF